MRIATSTAHEITLEGAEVFAVTGPAAFSGSIVTALISRVRISRNSDESLSWRLFGYKVKRDGSESMVPFEYNPISDREGRDIWVQIPREIRAALPHSVEFAHKYFG
jgi:hypothetical protein